MPSDIAPFISLGVGLLGVAIGLTGDLIRRKWQQPKLELLPFRPRSGDAVYFDLFTIGSLAVYVRFGIRNVGRDVARNVEVCVEAVELLDRQPDPRRQEAFQRQVVEGLIGRRLKWADRDESLVDIPPGTVRRVDIANIHNTDPSYIEDDGSLVVPLRITLSKSSDIYRNVLAGQHYRLQVSVSSSNSKTRQFSFVLRFGGK